MRILFVSSEVFPFSKSGGLADVAGALPSALAALGHEVLVVSPWYKTLNASPLWIGDVEVPFDGGMTACGVGTLERGRVRHAFVGHDSFSRDDLYGYQDDPRRFALFSRAVPQVATRVGFQADIVHSNDWHAAPLAMILQEGWHLPQPYVNTPSMFTVHNVQYQGEALLDAALYWLRLPGALRDSYLNHFGSANYMQAALGYAEHVSTVSPSYAEEIRQPEYGYGLDGTFRHIGAKLSGILNGLDTEVWDPQTDAHLSSRYSAETLTNKSANKEQLVERFRLDPARPLLAIVSRFADQKGIDIAYEALSGLLEQGWNLLALGSGEKDLEALWQNAASQHVGRVAAFIGYNEALAHQVYGGADALLIPSRFEPCGLTQMIGMRYGTLPIARNTGGLKDTVSHRKTGFLFDHATPESLLGAGREAKSFYDTAERWRDVQLEAMAGDFSWQTSARAYTERYEQIIGADLRVR